MYTDEPAIRISCDVKMRVSRPHTVSFLLALAASALVSPAAAQSAEPDSDAGRFAAITGAAQSFSQGVGQWLGFGGESSTAEAARSTSPSLDSTIRLSPQLMLEAFPALTASDDSLHLRDISHEHSIQEHAPGLARELDLSASYIWESPRFGQFVLSTNTTYVYNTSNGNPDAVRDSATTLSASEGATAALGVVPELQSSLTFTWQIGNHTATAVTSYTDGIDSISKLGNDIVNIEQLNELMGEIATLDLRYGYNVKAGRQGNASISVGVRSQFDRRALTPAVDPVSNRLLDTPGRVAYGTIKYQF